MRHASESKRSVPLAMTGARKPTLLGDEELKKVAGGTATMYCSPDGSNCKFDSDP